MALPQPDYSLLKNLPVADPVGSALGAYTTIEKEKRARQTSQLQQQLGGMQIQKEQAELKYLPEKQEMERKTHEAALLSTNLQIHQARTAISDHGLTNIALASHDQKENAYQQYKTRDIAAIGGDHTKLPDHYNAEVEAEAQMALRRSPLSKEDRDFKRKVALQTLKNQGALGVALQKAKAGFGGGKLTGVAGEAQSDILFKQHYKDDPESLNLLKEAHDRKDRMANARLFTAIPSDERGQWIAKAKSFGFDQAEAVRRFSRGENLQDLAQDSKAFHKPVTSESRPPTLENATNATKDSLDKDIVQVKKATARIDPNTITPLFAQTGKEKSTNQLAAQASAGMDYLSKYIVSGLNYGGITSRMTRPWVLDGNSSDPKRQQKAVDYYSAQAIKPELAFYRTKVQGGTPSARALAIIEPTILGSITINSSNVPKALQRRVQTQVTHILTEAQRQSSLQTLAPNPNIYDPKVLDTMRRTISSSPDKGVGIQGKVEGGVFISSTGTKYTREQLQQMAGK